jgi:MSHA biogenesis protein MshE
MAARAKIGDLLIASEVITEEQLEAALKVQRDSRRPLGMILVRMGCLDEEVLVRNLAMQLKIPVVKLTGKLVNEEVLARVPGDLAEKYRCIPLLINDEGGKQVLYLGMEDPADSEAVEEIRKRIGDDVKPVLVAPTELDEALHRHYQWASYDESSEPLGDDSEPVFEALTRSTPKQAQAPLPSSAPVQSPEILRALAQLLVEKGIITRDELVERIRQMAAEDGSSD